ncbi:chromosomal replication initiator DnaA [Sphingomonas sp.]|uniref:HdaA/DnaA family protein n=1 Tax=Sphingomonas sp. TaxID=28214 RepID=UPI0025FED93F|nr:chromosomal replication initiator DnaA [Sphingomonas sp.]
MNQIALPLDWPAAETENAFIVSPSNADAVRHLHSRGTWPVCATILTGPRKSGRSLLGRVIAAQTGGTLIDNAQDRDETEIFHAWNEAQRTRRALVLVADAAPPEWQVKLIDLRSRLAATPHVAIGDPDEALIDRLITMLLERRGLIPQHGVVPYLTPRVERSHHAVIALVDALDAASLASHRAITVPLARAVLSSIDASAAAG